MQNGNRTQPYSSNILNFSNESVYLDKHALIGTLHFYTGYTVEQDILVVVSNNIEVKNENGMLPCTPKDTDFMCSSTEVDTYRKIKFIICKQHRDIFSLHQGDIGLTKLCSPDTGDYPPIAQKLYSHLLKHTE